MNLRLHQALFALMLFIASCGAPPTGVVAPETVPTDARAFKVQEYRLENGLRVLTLEDHSAPIVAVQLWYHVGSKDEDPNRKGFAHMFEHMMFQGTARVAEGEHMRLIESVGGQSNAYTAFDQTVYTQTVPATQLELVMWLESERMAFLKIDEESFATEREVVAEEYHNSAEQPYGTVLEAALPFVFPEGTYTWSPIGDMEQLHAASAGELKTFWDQHYVPNNATLVVVGDVTAAQVEALAERYFGWIPATPDVATEPAAAATGEQEHTLTLTERKGPAPIVGLIYRTVPAGDKDENALELLGDILGGGESSRLYQRLVVKDQVAMMALGAGFSLESAGVLGVGAVLNPVGGDLDEAATALREELAKVRSEGVSEAELAKVKANAARALVTTQLSVDRKASLLGTAAVLYGDVEKANSALAELQAVTTADLQRVAQTYLKDESVRELRIKPSVLGLLANSLPAAKEAAQDEPKPAPSAGVPTRDPASWGKPGLVRPDTLGDTPPLGAPIGQIPPLQVSWHTLDNGLRVGVVSNDEVPYVSLQLGLAAGAWSDPVDLPGAASIATSMLTRGTQTFSYSALSEALANDAITLGAWANMDNTSVSATALTENADRAAELMAEVVLRPTFPEAELKTLLEQVRTGRAIEEKSPNFLASRATREQVWAGHFYQREPSPALSEIDAITSPGLAAWWAQAASPKQAVLLVSGDLTADEAFALAQKHFGAWKATQEPVSVDAQPPARRPTHIILVDTPGEQARVELSQVSITRHDPRYAAAQVLSHIFGGGGLASRLNGALRGDQGLTYGVYGGVNAQRFAGEFSVSLSTRNDVAVQSVRSILEQIELLRTTAPSDEEIERTKQAILGSFVLGRETPQDVSQDLWLLESQDLPEDFYERYVAGVAAVTPESLQTLAHDLIDPEMLTIVVVGPAAELREGLAAIAPVTVVQTDGVTPVEEAGVAPTETLPQ